MADVESSNDFGALGEEEDHRMRVDVGPSRRAATVREPVRTVESVCIVVFVRVHVVRSVQGSGRPRLKRHEVTVDAQRSPQMRCS